MQISAIARVDHRNVGTGKLGDNTAKLRDFYTEVVHGRSAKYRQWCHPVFEKAPTSSTSTKRTTVSVK